MNNTTHVPPNAATDAVPGMQAEAAESVRRPEARPAVRNQAISTYAKVIATLNTRISAAAAQKMASCLADYVSPSGYDFAKEIEILIECIHMLTRPAWYNDNYIDAETQVAIVECAARYVHDKPRTSSLYGPSDMGRFAECIWKARADIIPEPIM